MKLIYHKGWRLTTSTGELECMAWDITLKFFYIDLYTIKKDTIS